MPAAYGCGGPIGSVAWSPDRRFVAYRAEAEETSEIRIVNGKTGELHAVLRADAGDRIFELAWSRDSAKLALRKHSGEGISVDVWDVDEEKQITAWEYTRDGLPGGFQSKMAWSDDGIHLAVSLLGEAGDNGTPSWHGHFYVLDVASGTTVLKHNLGGWNHRSDIASLAWKSDGEGLVAGNRDGLIEAVAVPSGRTLFSTRLHSTTVSSLAWSPNGERIACAAEDGSVKVLAAGGGDDLVTFTLQEGASHVAWSPDAKRLAAAGDAGEVRVWDASRGYEFAEQGGRQGELAQAYYQNSRQSDPERDRARLREVLTLAPDTLDFWELRGHASVKLGNFDRATAEFAKAIQPGLRRSFGAAWYYGNALLAARNQEAYGRHCVTCTTTGQNFALGLRCIAAAVTRTRRACLPMWPRNSSVQVTRRRVATRPARFIFWPWHVISWATLSRHAATYKLPSSSPPRFRPIRAGQ